MVANKWRILEKDLQGIVKGCESPYFPDFGCHPESSIVNGIPVIKILPNQAQQHGGNRPQSIPTRHFG